ncbi:YjcZ family sporulation protein [Paenibacillus sp. S33]|nr:MULTISPECIES: YjcZ family sporulation protein [Paenibacillus]MCP3796315.1 YjcZ family sporulation protein [Paenibacillus sp. CH40]MCP3808408.1 YjcZ family sporulation protein [Paenibacillus sp. Lou8.1]MDY8048816.1 YjcZ family sporulation protein [Paenibacillus polymyxa]
MSHMCGVGGGMGCGVGAWTSVGAILVLFILLVIISKTLFL